MYEDPSSNFSRHVLFLIEYDICPIECPFPGLVKVGVKNFGQQGVKNNSAV